MMPVIAVPDNNIFAQIEQSGRLFEAASHAHTSDLFELTTAVLVIGTGAGGAVIGKELAEAGMDVIMVEAGPFWRPFRDFNQREETMNPALLYNAGARANHDNSLFITHGKGVGGSTVHNICLSVEPPDAIIGRWQEEFGYPWSRSDMQPFVDRVKIHLGINPVFPQQMNRNNLLLKAGADNLGWHGFVPHHNRLACLECGFCELGCAFNRKQSALITWIPKAIWAGARLVADTRIDSITHDGTRVTGAEGVMLVNGRPARPIRIRARTVVTAGGSIMTPALLRRSGIPDPYELIGSSFRTHPAVPVGGFANDDVIGWKGIPQTYMVDEHARFYKGGYGGYIIFPVFGHPGQTGALVPGMGPEYVERMSRYRKLVAIAPMIHDETMGRIHADRDGEPVIRYFPDATDQRELIEGVVNSVALLLAAGLPEVFVPYLDQPLIVRNRKGLNEIRRRGIPRRRIALNAVHPQGAVRFAREERDGAVLFSGEYRYLKNLFIGDASLFPTSIGTAPTITVMTVASMVAAGMIRDRERLT